MGIRSMGPDYIWSVDKGFYDKGPKFKGPELGIP